MPIVEAGQMYVLSNRIAMLTVEKVEGGFVYYHFNDKADKSLRCLIGVFRQDIESGLTLVSQE